MTAETNRKSLLRRLIEWGRQPASDADVIAGALIVPTLVIVGLAIGWGFLS